MAEKLTKARKALILALPADGSWGSAPSRPVAKRAWWNIVPPIIDHKHCPEDRNEWALTEHGQRLRATLNQSENRHGK